MSGKVVSSLGYGRCDASTMVRFAMATVRIWLYTQNGGGITKMVSEHSEQKTDSGRGFLRRKWGLIILVVLCLLMAVAVAARLWDEFHQPETPRRRPD